MRINDGFNIQTTSDDASWVEGSAGDVLTSGGTGASMSWAAPVVLTGCRIYNSADITAADGVVTECLWDGETFDTDGFHSTASATGRITIPAGEGGTYRVKVNLSCGALGSGASRLEVIIRVNGVDAAWATYRSPAIAAVVSMLVWTTLWCWLKLTISSAS